MLILLGISKKKKKKKKKKYKQISTKAIDEIMQQKSAKFL